MKEYHCIICIQSKPIAEFSKWTANKLKSRRCDSCQDDSAVRARIEKNQRDSDAKSRRSNGSLAFNNCSGSLDLQDRIDKNAMASDSRNAKTPAMAKQEQDEINVAKVIRRRKIEDAKMAREYDDEIGL